MKHGLSDDERRHIGSQKATFCMLKGNILFISMLYTSKQWYKKGITWNDGEGS